MATTALWNTFSNIASGPSLFERIGAAGYNNASGGTAGSGTASFANPTAQLNAAIDASRAQAASAVSNAQQYGGQAIDASRQGVDASRQGVNTATDYGNRAIGASNHGVDAARQGLGYATDYGNQAIDASNLGVDSARQGLDYAMDYGNRAISSGQSGVDAILSGRPYVDQAYADMRGAADAAGIGYDAAYYAARGMDPYIRGLADEAGNIHGVANSLSPLAGTLGGYGDSMWESGTKVTDQALATLGTGLGFINMDSGASPLVAEAVRIYGEFDPDKYVAAAAQDMQTQGENVRAQNERNLARRGVSPTSGAAQALSNQYDRALAVARAAAMTRARERGQTDQMNALQSLIANNANTFLQTGGQLASIGASAQGQAVNAQKGAADVLNTQGGLYGQAGNLLGNAGQIQGTQGNLLASIAGGRANLAGIYGNAANLVTGYNKDLSGAYNTLANITSGVGQNVVGANNSLVSAYNALAGVKQSAGNAILGANNALVSANNNLSGATQSAGNAITGAQNNLASAYNSLGSTTLNAGNSVTGALERQASNTLSGEQLRVSAVNAGNRGTRLNGGVNVIDNTNNAIAARLAAGARDPIARFN